MPKIVKATTKILFILWILCFHPLGESGADLKSPLNDLSLKSVEEPKQFSFIVTGHIYGSRNKSVYPSASLLANIHILNNSNAAFMVLLGDIIEQANVSEIHALKDSFLSKVNLPVFNAPGNHDLLNRRLYAEHFGETFFSFRYSSSFFIFLDSKINNGKIESEQLNLVMEGIEYCRKSSQIKNIFIFSHHLLWAIGNPPYSDIIPFVNGPRDHPSDATTVSRIILPKLNGLAGKNIYFVSGDVGAPSSLPLFYEKETTSNVTYAATGMGDIERDLVLLVDIRKSGEVVFTPISLAGQKLHPVEYYNLDYWKRHFNKNATFKNYLIASLSALCFLAALFFLYKNKKRHG